MAKLDHYRVIGLMSGTSLDGLDIAYCTFSKEGAQWVFDIRLAETVAYPAGWKKRLAEAHDLSAEELVALDHEFGRYLGKAVLKFVTKHKVDVDFVSSHGHTIFHQPSKGFTLQIGNGNSIYAACGLPVIWDFRTLDVTLGGEGAPLVPIGDRLLFSDYDVCLNLGGIANLSHEVKKERIAYDICFCNMGLNYLSSMTGKAYDNRGVMASNGEVSKPLLKKLEQVYKSLSKKRPSLGREIFEKKIRPVLDDKRISVEDRLRTFTESIAMELVRSVAKQGSTVLCTGGGAFNSFLLSRMLDLGGDEISWIVPEEDVVKFKEATVFAFLGVLRHRNEINVLRSVTHAKRDSCAGLMTGF